MHLSFNNIKSSQVIIDNEKINEELKEIIKIIGQVSHEYVVDNLEKYNYFIGN